MTKEELNKESQQYTLSHTTPSLYRVVDQAYLAGAEPREKQIEIDAVQILALQKQNGELTDKVRELEQENERLNGDLELWESGACRATNLDKCGVVQELKAQIEKMKCCANCKHSRTEYEHCRTDKHEKWEIKEK